MIKFAYSNISRYSNIFMVSSNLESKEIDKLKRDKCWSKSELSPLSHYKMELAGWMSKNLFAVSVLKILI